MRHVLPLIALPILLLGCGNSTPVTSPSPPPSGSPIPGTSATSEWPHVPYSEVRAYAWKPNDKLQEEEFMVNRTDLSVAPGAVNPKGTVLSPEQVAQLIKAVTRSDIKYEQYKCYDPHNAFVFYNADKQPVAFVEICFDCLGQVQEPAREPRQIDLPALATIFYDLKLPIGAAQDAESFRRGFEKNKL